MSSALRRANRRLDKRVGRGSGTVTVDGRGSTWGSTGLLVGGQGNGTLIVTNGGTVSDGAGYGYIGYGPSSIGVATVAGAGSIWNNSESLYVGYYGTGTLNVANGATVNSTNGFLASARPTAAGTVTVDGPGSTWANAGICTLNNGMLRITNGGAVTVTGGGLPNGLGITIYSNSATTGILTVDGAGSSFTNTTSLLRLVAPVPTEQWT